MCVEREERERESILERQEIEKVGDSLRSSRYQKEVRRRAAACGHREREGC